MNKALLSLLLVATQVTTSIHAEDGFNFIGGDAQAEKVKTAEQTPDCGTLAVGENGIRIENQSPSNLTHNASLMALGVGAGALDASLGMAFAGPGYAGMVVLAPLMVSRQFQKKSEHYSGTLLRGSVISVAEGSQDFTGRAGWATLNRLNETTMPSDDLLDKAVVQVKIDTGDHGLRWVFAPKAVNLQKGDIVDMKLVSGRSAKFKPIWEKNDQSGDFNKHIPRVVSLVCSQNDEKCISQPRATSGLLCRHTDTEFPLSQYLIDPAIIAADQAKMRKEEEERKAASNNGGFNFM